MNKRLAKYGAPVLCIFLIITAAIYYEYSHIKAQLIPETQKYLESILNERSNEIYVYLDQQEKLIQDLAHDEKFIEIFMGDTKNIDKDKLDSATKLYRELPTINNLLFIQYNGDIIASMENQENFKGKNILQAPWNTSDLSESFMRSSMTLTTDISGFEFNQLIKKPALFISTPIIAHDTIYGCIVFELNIEPIYLILRKYIGLKKTGEVTLGREEGNKVMYISPTRHSPNMFFKSLDDEGDYSDDDKALVKQTMRHAIFDKRGSGEAIDYRGHNVVAAWSYLTRIDWGIVAKIDTDEVLAPVYRWYIYLLLSLLITLLLCFLNCILMRKKIIQHMHTFTLSLPRIVRIFLWFGMVISMISMFVSAYNLQQKKQASITDALQQAKQQTSHAAHFIDENVNYVQSIVQALADDLTSGTLSAEFLEKRMMIDLRENPSLIEITIAYEPYAYTNDTRLYAFSIGNAQGTFKKSYFGDVYDYTKPSSPGEPESDWYVRALKQGGIWSNPLQEPYSNLSSIDYSVPFFDADKKPLGVVAISYNVQAVQKIINEIKIGETGYGFAISRNGTFIAFPDQSYVSNEKTFIDLAQEKANEKLMALAEHALVAQEPFHGNFFDVKTNQGYSVYVTQATKAGWSVGVIFAEDEVSISPLDVRRGYFYIIICLLLGLLFLVALGCNAKEISLSIIRNFSVPTTAILFLALLATWKIIIDTNISHDAQKYGTIIVDQSRLNKFLNEVKDNVNLSQSDEPQPLFMPTGVYLYSFSLPKIQHITLSGNIWQKLDVSLFKDVPKEIQMPRDISLSLKELAKSIENNVEIRVSTFDATIFNEQDFSEFPFDKINIRLNMSSQALARNIILIPDLAAYDNINPIDKPGIDKDFVLPGFEIQKTFFSLKKLIPDNDFGLPSFRAITEHYDLVFNIVITRKLLNSFILYILPLLVILLALFATLFGIRENKIFDPLKPLAAYASLFFGLIILHRSIREQYGVVSTLYIEYAFFYTYITLLFLLVHAVIVYGPNSNKTFDTIITPLALYLYWPIQLSLWLITTLCMFN